MIIINDEEYKNYDIVTSWNKFSYSFNNYKKTGIAPFITFNIENISIGFELTFEDIMFKTTKIKSKSKYKRLC